MTSTLAALAGLFRPTNESPVPQSTGVGGLAAAGGIATRATIRAQLDAYARNATLHAICDRLATTQSAINWRLYRTRTDARRTYADERDDARLEVVRHPALSVLEQPNPHMTQAELFELTALIYELTGVWYLAVARAPAAGPTGTPLELWPVRPDLIEPVRDPRGFIAGYMYTGGGEQVPLGLTDVIAYRHANPVDFHQGTSPVATLLTELAGESNAAAYNAKFFENGALPGGIIKPNRELSDGEFRTLLTRWRESHRGTNNAHRVGVLSWGEFIELKNTRRDMQFTELRTFANEQIRRAFGFPKPLLGDVDDVNRANAEAAADMFSKWLTVPRATRFRDALNHKYLPLFGRDLGVEFDFDDPTPPNRDEDRQDRNAAVERAARLIELGADPVEVFEHEGLPAFTMTEPAAENDLTANTPITPASEDEDAPSNRVNGHGGRVPELARW